jgi:hypothetical protein
MHDFLPKWKPTNQSIILKIPNQNLAFLSLRTAKNKKAAY